MIARTPALKPIVACYLLWQIASLVYPSIWAYYGVAAFNWTPAIIGASLAGVGILMATVQSTLTGRFVHRLGERRTAQIGLLSALGGFIGYVFATTTFAAFAVLPFMALQSLVQPSLSAMLSQRVPANAQGEIQGIGGSIMSLGAVIAPLLYNPALAHFTSGGRHFPGAPIRSARSA